MDHMHRTHRYLLSNSHSSLRRGLMDEIDWSKRLIGIKGARGVGKTTFLLDYAAEHYQIDDRRCLYANLNQFCFSEMSIIGFAEQFVKDGGEVLLLDQVFKYPNWSEELRYCYEHFPSLKIVFTGSTVMRLKEENEQLRGICQPYTLNGFSFREFLYQMTGHKFPVLKLSEIQQQHEEIAREIVSKAHPALWLNDFIHHGHYPFFLEKHNYSENLLKAINMMLEVDVLLIRQIDQRFLHKLRRMLYLMSMEAPAWPNVSKLSQTLELSRATVGNYMQYLADARLVNLLYKSGDNSQKKPSKYYLHNPNLCFVLNPQTAFDAQTYATFFLNQVKVRHDVSVPKQNGIDFLLDNEYSYSVQTDQEGIRKSKPRQYTAVANIEVGKEKVIPLWLFGFLY
ncbi:ATPase AAA [Porphyromonas crevioricanis]|uniref:ATPase AAA n=1 Tax=Porphyromonas crevioricanis TaxID=393921 RepID=A0A0A2FY15_9PORP|nr:AAA family ATPase [Porphyromonas crevioricanis]KGN88865.1 ATPase AAA [Porphyromonas crevioricanis]KGN95861.1 ATPase AAA [Porphyromonas crevioricanis]SQH73494.1 Uncharacterised protein [Porphyromonas crevioricanis]